MVSFQNISLDKTKQYNSNKNKKHQFSIDAFSQRIKNKPHSNPIYRQLVSFVSRKNFSITENELEQLKDLVNYAPNEELTYLINYAIYNVETRLNNYSELSNYNYKIVSLGYNCMSRTITTRWGLKLPKVMGELTHPFDLSVHPYTAICKVIENEFLDYLNPLLYKQNKNGVPKHQKYKIIFNHERDSYFSQANFAPLIKTYKARIENFYQDIEQYPILFLHFSNPKQNIFPHELALILLNKFKNVHHKFMCINTGQPISGQNTSDLPQNLIYRHIPLPYEEYRWQFPVHYSTEIGKNFEVSIIREIKQVIINNFHNK